MQCHFPYFCQQMASRTDFSIIALIICLSAWFFNLKLTNRQDSDDILKHDVSYYYGYLPAYFIYNDLTYSFMDTTKNLPDFACWYLKAPNGGRFSKMSMGMAMMYSPFFLIGHYSSLRSVHYHDKANGFTHHYKSWLTFGTVFYAFLGLFFLRKVLLLFFGTTETGITLLLIGLGTNLYCYVVHDVLMSHSYSFFLFSLFAWLTHSWYSNKKFGTAFLLGIVFGLISLIRPTNALIALFFILWDVRKSAEILPRIVQTIGNGKLLITGLVGVSLIWLPQILYWKINIGNYFVYSYGNEGFFWMNPKIGEVLFSWRKGLFIYTPIMIFAFWGMIYLRKQASEVSLAIPVFIVLNLYVVSAWWCWWYGGSFGLRALIESYALMAIPLAAFIKVLMHLKQILLQNALWLLLVFFVYLNQFQTYQYTTSLLHYDGMTQKVYWKILFHTHWYADYEKDIQRPDYDKASRGLE